MTPFQPPSNLLHWPCLKIVQHHNVSPRLKKGRGFEETRSEREQEGKLTAMASSASSSLLASTSIFSENPPTDLAFFTALVMDPGHRVSEGLGRWVVVVGPMCKIITLAPNVVVLQHDHRRQVHSVSINATHQHRVLLHHPETFKKPRKSQKKREKWSHKKGSFTRGGRKVKRSEH